MQILRRIVCLILFPRTELRQIAVEPASVDRLIRHYILPLSLLAPAATAIGMKTFDAAWDPLHGYTVPAEQIYDAVPVQVAGIALLVPSMIIVSMVALCHTLYLYYAAAAELLEVPADACTEFVGISMVILVVLSIAIGAAVSATGLI